MIEIFIYSFISNLVFYSYGHFIRYSNFSNKIENINDRSILGCILISFTALVLNFFLPLGKELNTFILIIGITYLLIIRKLKYKKKEFFYILLSSVITSSLILYSNINRPDGGLYHLPYISYLNEHKLIFGLSNIHFRFGMTSILQYLSAANFNLIFKEIGIVIPLASVVTFFIIYFFNKVLKILKNTKNISYSNIFSLFIIIFIAYKINRYSSFGNDAVAHLSLFYLLSKILSKEKPNLVFISLIAVFGFLNKTTLIIILLIPLYFFLKNLNIKNFKIFLSLPSFFLILWVLKNIFISGCLIYPIKETCFKNLSWTDFEEIENESISGEAWSKDWPNRIDKNISMIEYNKKLNWLKSWSMKHGKLMFKIIFPYFLVCFIIYFLIRKKKNSDEYILLKNNNFLIFLILFTFIGTILFFIKFPLYRYGYSYLLSFLLLIMTLFLSKLDKLKLIQISKVVMVLCIIVFFGKQFQRYYKNFNNVQVWPRIYSYTDNSRIESKKILFENDLVIYQYDGLCMYSSSPCSTYMLKNNLKIKNKFSYVFVNIEN